MPGDLQQASGRKQEDDPEEEVPPDAAASPGCVPLVWLLCWLQPLCSPFLNTTLHLLRAASGPQT